MQQFHPARLLWFAWTLFIIQLSASPTLAKRISSMKRITVTSCLLFILSLQALAQPPWQEAPEKWGAPLKVRELSLGQNAFASQPSLTADEKRIFYYYYSDGKPYGISLAIWQDSVWSSPVPLNSNVNRDLAAGPSISPDGKRLYFRMYGRSDGYGGRDLYYSDWDSTTQNWGPAINLGPNINQAHLDEWSCMTPDNKNLYWTRYPSPPRISTWNDTTQRWGPSQWVDLYHFLSASGRTSVTSNRRKAYYDVFVDQDLYVNYYNTLQEEWSYPMVLNINKMMDTLVATPFQRIQQYPWISPDGRTLYFASTHDSTWGIWMSKLVIDENDNPVSVESPRLSFIPSEIDLLQNYPNPFNPVTVIEYDNPASGYVDLKIFDLLGREVVTLVHEQKQPGKYRVEWKGRDQNSQPVPSGMYFFKIEIGGRIIVKKMIVLR